MILVKTKYTNCQPLATKVMKGSAPAGIDKKRFVEEINPTLTPEYHALLHNASTLVL